MNQAVGGLPAQVALPTAFNTAKLEVSHSDLYCVISAKICHVSHTLVCVIRAANSKFAAGVSVLA